MSEIRICTEQEQASEPSDITICSEESSQRPDDIRICDDDVAAIDCAAATAPVVEYDPVDVNVGDFPSSAYGGIPPYTFTSTSNMAVDPDTGEILAIDACGAPGDPNWGTVTITDACNSTGDAGVRFPGGEWGSWTVWTSDAISCDGIAFTALALACSVLTSPACCSTGGTDIGWRLGGSGLAFVTGGTSDCAGGDCYTTEGGFQYLETNPQHCSGSKFTTPPDGFKALSHITSSGSSASCSGGFLPGIDCANKCDGGDCNYPAHIESATVPFFRRQDVREWVCL